MTNKNDVVDAVEVAPTAPTEEAVNVKKGLVIYSDGGVRPTNPGYGGWGIHGYLYTETPPKKGSGNPDHVLTVEGYLTKVEHALQMQKLKEVTPVHYIDGCGSFVNEISNNVAEMVATLTALRHAAEYEISSIVIRTDSEYVCNGLEKWVVNWAKNGWLKQDGTPPSNVDLWKELVAAKDILVHRGVSVKMMWVRSHNNILGNVQADKLATIGVMTSRRRIHSNTITVAPAEGYWKYSTDKHPFIANRRMYFNTLREFVRPGEYFLGEHGKDDDLLGNRIADGAYSVVYLEKPDMVLEMVRDYQISLANSTNSIAMVRLDHLYRPDTHREISTYGTLAMEQPSQYRLDLACLDREPLTRELRPPMLAQRAVDALSELCEKLLQYQESSSKITITDLTPIIYETIVKPGKKGQTSSLLRLRPEFNVGFAALPVNARYDAQENGVATASITLTLGIDLLDRNALKRLEDFLPKVSLISWLEAPGMFRYATIIEAGNDKGIWAGTYSNLRVVPPETPVTTDQA